MIRPLPKHIINQIAAGEVVERPASIVKELVENSLDAGATKITIAILDAGLTEIKIQDNGSGISREDFPHVFQRHATSKIEAIEDLETLSTMGFRGEALSSIQAVAQVEMMTKTKADTTGYYYNPYTEEIKPIAQSQEGTTIIIRNLFYNLPARKKFLKSHSTELSHITRIVEEIALVHPEIEFMYTSQERTVFHVLSGDSLSRVVALLKIKDTEYLLPVDSQKQNIQLRGYIGHPRISKRSPQYHIFVNNRPVLQPLLHKAIQQGFDTMLEVGHYPFAFISLHINPEEVDVNVHPRKTEVKFIDDKMVFSTVKYMVKDILQKSAFDIVLKPHTAPTPLSSVNIQSTPYSHPKNSYEMNRYESPSRVAEPAIPSYTPPQSSHPILSSIPPTMRDLLEPETQKPTYLHLFDTYIVYPNQQGMMILDQHAIHEKIILEQLMQADYNVQSQQLLFPIVHTVPQSEKELIIEVLSQLSGFEVDDFGSSEIIIRAVPTFLTKNQKTEAHIDTLIAIIIERGQTTDLEELRIELLKTIACKSAIKAGYPISRGEIEALIRDGAKTDFGFACCHGRPTMVQLDKDWFEKQFSR